MLPSIFRTDRLPLGGMGLEEVGYGIGEAWHDIEAVERIGGGEAGDGRVAARTPDIYRLRGRPDYPHQSHACALFYDVYCRELATIGQITPELASAVLARQYSIRSLRATADALLADVRDARIYMLTPEAA